MLQPITDIPRVNPRVRDGHKGTYGKVLVIGGSCGMIGAPALAAKAALRSGSGLVRIAVPASIQLSVAQITPCATTIPLSEQGNGSLGKDSRVEILRAMEENDSVALGCGIGMGIELQAIVESVVKECKVPLVLDADGLNNLANCGAGIFGQLSANTVLTPHPGEMKRLWRAVFREEFPMERQEQAQKLASRCQAVIVLKGAGTVVSDGKRIYVNRTGNPGMATGGSGDVLTGVIASILANASLGLDTFSAAVLGVYVHGRAGDLGAASKGEIGLIASDLIDFLPMAWKEVEQ